ncbi:fatty acid desaturase [Ectothiorhodospiraceae bacterium WFHF3C12]|nr:fatty acid desaturase [Ectothiorhodospiraceae bacterium WFHF3C12]
MATACTGQWERTVPSLSERRIPGGHNALKIAVFLGYLATSFAGTDFVVSLLASTGAGSGTFAGTLSVVAAGAVMALAAIPNAMVMLATAVLAHEAVHRTLFRSRLWNDAWGGLLSALALIPFHANRRFHLTHHAYAHQRGRDPENEMHDRGFVQALAHGAFHGLKCQYRTWARQLRAQTDARRQRLRALADAFCLAAAAGLYFAATTVSGISPWVTSVPMILAFPVVFSLRALCDHYGIPEAAPRSGAGASTGAHQVTGWVILTHPLLEWLWSSVNYHEVHHKFPHLAHCDLRRVYYATREELPYLTAPGYFHCLKLLRQLPYYSRTEDVDPYWSTPQPTSPSSERHA